MASIHRSALRTSARRSRSRSASNKGQHPEHTRTDGTLPTRQSSQVGPPQWIQVQLAGTRLSHTQQARQARRSGVQVAQPAQTPR